MSALQPLPETLKATAQRKCTCGRGRPLYHPPSSKCQARNVTNQNKTPVARLPQHKALGPRTAPPAPALASPSSPSLRLSTRRRQYLGALPLPRPLPTTHHHQLPRRHQLRQITHLLRTTPLHWHHHRRLLRLLLLVRFNWMYLIGFFSWLILTTTPNKNIAPAPPAPAAPAPPSSLESSLSLGAIGGGAAPPPAAVPQATPSDPPPAAGAANNPAAAAPTAPSNAQPQVAGAGTDTTGSEAQNAAQPNVDTSGLQLASRLNLGNLAQQTMPVARVRF